VAPEPALVDVVVLGAAEIATPRGNAPLAGAALARIDVLARAGVAIDAGRVVAVLPEADLRGRFRGRRELDARGGTIVPGFVDAHTHPVFAGTREGEFEMRTAGASYAEIAARGGGILSSVRGRARGVARGAAGRAARAPRPLPRARDDDDRGEIGLRPDPRGRDQEPRGDRRRRREHAVEIVPTFLGAHAVPEEYIGRREQYVDLVVDAMLPRIAERGLGGVLRRLRRGGLLRPRRLARILGARGSSASACASTPEQLRDPGPRSSPPSSARRARTTSSARAPAGSRRWPPRA
jgi:imidazolonepropionase